MSKILKFILVGFSVMLIASCFGKILVKDVDQQFGTWNVKIIALEDDATIAALGNVSVTAKEGNRLVELKIEIVNTSAEPETINLENIVLKTTAATYSPEYIRHWFLTSVSKIPKVSPGEKIERMLIYGLPNGSIIQSIQMPDGGNIKID